jgi:hypothetical protein
MAFAERERKIVNLAGDGYVRLIAYYDPAKVTDSDLEWIEGMFSMLAHFEESQRSVWRRGEPEEVEQ